MQGVKGAALGLTLLLLGGGRAWAAVAVEPLPQEVEVRMRPLPPDRERVVVGTDVIILDKTTQKILDIIRDVAILHRDITR